MKKNCWEHKKCGRETGGSKVNELGVCPVALEGKMNGIHGGKNGGRTCWIVAGSLCGGKIQGTFANKFQNCKTCDFYNMVKAEESSYFKLSAVLLNMLK